MIVLHHYPRAHHRASGPPDLGANGYVPRHRRCLPGSHFDMPVMIGSHVGWQCVSCGRLERA